MCSKRISIPIVVIVSCLVVVAKGWCHPSTTRASASASATATVTATASSLWRDIPTKITTALSFSATDDDDDSTPSCCAPPQASAAEDASATNTDDSTPSCCAPPQASAAVDASATNTDDSTPSCCAPPQASAAEDVSGMRLSEIKSELRERNIGFADCFDKESMVLKLADARANNIDNSNTNDKRDDDENSNDREKESSSSSSSSAKASEPFDRDAALEELKGMRVRELREELGRRQISRVGLFEKEDLVNALVEARAIAWVYSGTGLLKPGEVSDLSAKDAQTEIDHPGSLLLLDVYATWCGPCQMLAPILKEIAAEEGDQLRVIKMDTDKNQEMSSQLKVNGLPTLVLFRGGNEIDRIEGAPTKEQLGEWIGSRR